MLLDCFVTLIYDIFLKYLSSVIVVDVAKGRDILEVPLICGEEFEGTNVTWTKNQGEHLEAFGNRIIVTVDGWKGANYSCYNSEGTILNNTLVLAQWTFKKFIRDTPEKGRTIFYVVQTLCYIDHLIFFKFPQKNINLYPS